MNKCLDCRHCGETVDVAISFGITNHLGEGMPLLHFHPKCFIEIAGTEYLEEMFEMTAYRLKDADKKKPGVQRRLY